MQETPHASSLARKALLGHAWSFILIGLAFIALPIGGFIHLDPNVQTVAAFGMVGVIGILAIVAGTMLSKMSRRMGSGLDHDLVRRSIAWFSVLVFLIGVLWITLDAVSNRSLGAMQSGVMWTLAGTLGFVAAKQMHPIKESTRGHFVTALALFSTIALTIGLAAIAPFNLFPSQHWLAFHQFFAGIGILGGIGVILFTTTASISTDDPGLDGALRFIARMAIALFGVAALRATIGFLIALDWGLLLTPLTNYSGAVTFSGALYVLVFGFIAWTVASILTILAGTVAVLTETERLDLGAAWSKLRSVFTRNRRARRASAQTLTCPQCKTKVDVVDNQRPVCPKCWYSGPQA